MNKPLLPVRMPAWKVAPGGSSLLLALLLAPVVSALPVTAIAGGVVLPGDSSSQEPIRPQPPPLAPPAQEAAGQAASILEVVQEEGAPQPFFEEEPLEDEEGSAEERENYIPPVIDRPLGVEEGPKTEIRLFQLLNARDLPRQNIFVAEIEQMLEELRVSGGGNFTVGQIQQISEEVTKYYRERGLILAQAVLPVQDIVEGKVNIELLEGKLGKVLVEGNEIYRPEVLTAPFEKLIGEPVVSSQIESRLLRLTDYPGLTVFGIFQPGKQVGSADLLLKVQAEDRQSFAYRGDNHGTQRIGRVRARADVHINNLTGGADRLQFNLQQAYNPKNQLFWHGEYHRYMSRGFYLLGFADRNRFRIGGEDFAAQDIASVTENQSIVIGKSFLRGRQRNFSAELGLTRKSSLSTSRGRPISDDRLSVLNVRLNYDSVDIRLGGLNFAFLEYAHGFNDILGAIGDAASVRQELPPSRRGGEGANNAYATGQFNKIRAGFTRLQTLTKHHSLLFRSELQWSPDLLLPLEQFSMGGPESVRGFGVAQVLWDTAALFSLEYLIDAPFIADQPAFGNRSWGELLQFSILADQAAGELNDPLQTQQEGFRSYRSAGIGLRFNIPATLSVRMMYAWELGNEPVENGRTPQYWIDLTYDF